MGASKAPSREGVAAAAGGEGGGGVGGAEGGCGCDELGGGGEEEKRGIFLFVKMVGGWGGWMGGGCYGRRVVEASGGFRILGSRFGVRFGDVSIVEHTIT